ncbi:lysozyme [Pendulispora brunnea]|uniref:Lysozyme n=1 Tax=Pendulispora brunnea TaxID=2905690 RepID=A0ABZ2K1G2_9BACT
MNVNFRLSRMVCRNAWMAGAILLLGVGCAAPAEGQDPETDTQNDDLRAGSEDHTAGSQIRLHEGADAPEMLTESADAVAATVLGCDVSGHQGNVNWAAAWNAGARFCYVKATEGTSYRNPYFAQQYNGSYNQGMIRGAYHFALPNNSSGTAQADFFVDHGGGWSSDGKTLPPALDMEYNPYGATCYGLSAASMVQWVRDFSNRVHARTRKYPMIYTSTSWWSQCTGNNGSFGSTNPLWIPRYGSSVGTLPAGWGFHTIWQYADSGSMPGDQNRFNGAYDRLQALATNPD